MEIRALCPDDAPSCVVNAATARWESEASRWQMMMRIGETFGAFINDELVGTVVAIPFGDVFVAIAMMVVHAEHRRAGIGVALMKRAEEFANGAVLLLYATEDGQRLYTPLGFQKSAMSLRFKGAPANAIFSAATRARDFRAEDFEAVCALDARAHGGPRDRLLRELIPLSLRARVIERDGVVAAYGLATEQRGTRLLGPIIAEDHDATELANDLAHDATCPLLLDVDEKDLVMRAWAERAGIPKAESAPQMWKGKTVPGERALIRGLAARAFP